MFFFFCIPQLHFKEVLVIVALLIYIPALFPSLSLSHSLSQSQLTQSNTLCKNRVHRKPIRREGGAAGLPIRRAGEPSRYSGTHCPRSQSMLGCSYFTLRCQAEVWPSYSTRLYCSAGLPGTVCSNLQVTLPLGSEWRQCTHSEGNSAGHCQS